MLMAVADGPQPGEPTAGRRQYARPKYFTPTCRGRQPDTRARDCFGLPGAPSKVAPSKAGGEFCSILRQSVRLVAECDDGTAQFCNAGVGNLGHKCHAAWQSRTSPFDKLRGASGQAPQDSGRVGGQGVGGRWPVSNASTNAWGLRRVWAEIPGCGVCPSLERG